MGLCSLSQGKRGDSGARSRLHAKSATGVLICRDRERARAPARALMRALRGNLEGAGHPCPTLGEDDLRVVRGFVFSAGASQQIREWILGAGGREHVGSEESSREQTGR